MYLNEQQLNFFHTFGFLHVPELFGPEEIAWITEEFNNVLQTYGSGKAHDGSKRTMIVPTIDHSERLCTLLDDARIVGIASDILGADFSYASGDGNYYTGDTGWHADGTYPELFAIKMAFYLDPVTRDTGCLRVLPGSHRADSFWRTENVSPRDSQKLWGIPPSEIPGDVALETTPGDLAIFYHDTFHASFGGGKRRRMFTMNLIKHGKTEPELARVDEYLRRHCPVAHGFKIGGMYTDLMLDTATPDRLHLLAQLHERHALVHPQDTRPRPLPSF
ncbi:MAG: phytanoyl-CoA dioxygenase family protein [Candidatus Poribacteria bacterium]|nr:phytanoyl-CoA dioxygenase family protein [Candidatus Poribacteria bacterium]